MIVAITAYSFYFYGLATVSIKTHDSILTVIELSKNNLISDNSTRWLIFFCVTGSFLSVLCLNKFILAFQDMRAKKQL